MLRFLNIQDFVIVDRMEIECVPGFTVLTGETGAGKSILIDALSLALGERSDAGDVRNGSKRAEISAEFDLSKSPELVDWLRENDLEGHGDDDRACLMRRVIEVGGRSRGFINGRSATLQQLRTAGEMLVDIHGQNEHQSLLRSEAQRDLLDAFSGSRELAQAVSTGYRRWKNLQQRRMAWEQNVDTFVREREQLELQNRELSTLNFSPDKWLTLQADHSRLSHSASLLEAAQSCLEIISEGESASLKQINSVISRLKGLLQYDANLKSVLDLLDSAQIQLQEAAYELGHYQQRIDLDPQSLQEMEERLSEVHAVARKYRVSPDELPSLLKTVTERLEELSQGGDGDAMAQEEAVARDVYLKLAKKLSVVRDGSARKLTQQVTAAMQSLAMEGGKFAVTQIPLEQGSAYGMEQIEFQVSPHLGLPLRPLAKVASGGELSRISLAIQVITSKVSVAPTLIFDEVDAGIGGRIAEIVGGLLKKLGTERQVMCVTHLAQVASAGDQQWQVAKSGNPTNGENILSHITILKNQERVEEIARMLGGVKITETTRKHAAEMLRVGK
ncbi:MAG: DNA repair protein RecN [Betaproteobacteria bacterium]|nr:MAG: DNA repair protein RecN [Betaproteobacteria bacterium]